MNKNNIISMVISEGFIRTSGLVNLEAFKALCEKIIKDDADFILTVKKEELGLAKTEYYELKNNTIDKKVLFGVTEAYKSINYGDRPRTYFLGEWDRDRNGINGTDDRPIKEQDIIKFIKKAFSIRTPFNENKKLKLLEEIKNDFSEFAKLIGVRGNEIETYESTLTLWTDDLGNWIDNEEDAYEHENPDSDSYDPGWREDNDNKIWADKKVYFKKFSDWVKTKKWKKYVVIGIETSEKNSASFYIKVVGRLKNIL